MLCNTQKVQDFHRWPIYELTHVVTLKNDIMIRLVVATVVSRKEEDFLLHVHSKCGQMECMKKSAHVHNLILEVRHIPTVSV